MNCTEARNIGPAWMTQEEDDAEHYYVSYDDEIDRQAAETADAMNQHGCQMMEQRPPVMASTPSPARSAAPSAYDKIKEEWKQRTDENNAEMERISKLQTQQFEDMKKMAGTFETMIDEKMGKLFVDVTAIITEDRKNANLVQADINSKMEGLHLMFTAMTESFARIEQAKRSANDEQAGEASTQPARRQRLAIADTD